MPQNVFITDRTIAENIAFDQRREDIDPERVREALEGARLWEFVSSQLKVSGLSLVNRADVYRVAAAACGYCPRLVSPP